MKTFKEFMTEAKKPMSAKEHEKWLKDNFAKMNRNMDQLSVKRWLKDKKNIKQAYQDYLYHQKVGNYDTQGYPEGHPLYKSRWN